MPSAIPSSHSSAMAALPPAPPTRPRFLSEADCQDIIHRLAKVTRGGGYTLVRVWSTWTGNVRWARNLIATSGEVRNDYIQVYRNLNGADNADTLLLINDISDAALVAATRRAERLARLVVEEHDSLQIRHLVQEPLPTPTLFFDATYHLDADARAAAARTLAQSAASAGMLSAGYIEVSAHSMAVLDTLGHSQYVNYTSAQYSVTVRDPEGTGSGWAGVDWPDWSRIDGPQLSALALDKCLRSRNPVAIEPGRYTTILEPQAVCDFIGQLMFTIIPAQFNLSVIGGRTGVFSTVPPTSLGMIGQKVVDERISLWTDPMDPDLGFPPFNPLLGPNAQVGNNLFYPVYHPAHWIDQGVLKHGAYDRQYAIDNYQRNTGLPFSGAFRMSGGPTTLEEMIATTARGLLVTRFSEVELGIPRSQLYNGYTRDGLWLIEHGKISKPVKNMRFVESVLFALNNVDQLGVPQRAFHPKKDWLVRIPQPVIVPPMKIRDFSFTALADAV